MGRYNVPAHTACCGQWLPGEELRYATRLYNGVYEMQGADVGGSGRSPQVSCAATLRYYDLAPESLKRVGEMKRNCNNDLKSDSCDTRRELPVFEVIVVTTC